MGLVGRVSSFIRTLLESRNDDGTNRSVSETELDYGGLSGQAHATMTHYADPGDDSNPLTTDWVFGAPTRSSQVYVAAGYLDPINEAQSQPGEKRIYSRNAETGEDIAEVFLKNTGEIEIGNEFGQLVLLPNGGFTFQTPESTIVYNADGEISLDNDAGGSFVMATSGDINANGMTVDTSGNVTIPGTLDVTGLTTVTADVIGAGVSLSTHIHNYIDSDPSTPQTLPTTIPI